MLSSDTRKGVSMSGNEGKTDIPEENGTIAEVADQPAAADVAVLDAADARPADEGAEDSGSVGSQREAITVRARRKVSVSVRALVLATLVATALAVAGIMTWLYVGAKTKLDAEARQTADNSHAEQVALDYAVDAAEINADDLNAWKKKLVKGTTPELTEKLNDAGMSMEQILVPLQWNSTAVPLVAKVRSNSGGIYVVDTFVGVETKTMQAPEGLQSTATYSITIDSNHEWQISDVGGIGAVVGQK